MKTVFVVSRGSYSDYRVEGIFTTRKKAELANTLWQGNGVQEWTLNEIPWRPPGMFMWEVTMDSEGCASRATMIEADGNHDTWTAWDGEAHFRMWAKTERAAIKIANERRQWLLANNLWTTDFDGWCERRSKAPWGEKVESQATS